MSVVLKNSDPDGVFFRKSEVFQFQAPRQAELPTKVPPVNHADILYRNGYDSPASLRRLASGWERLFGHLAPDHVLTEAAPTAALVASRLGLPVTNLDSGFFCPPISDPLPALRSWEPVPILSLREKETRALDTINTTLKQMNMQLLGSFSDVFSHDTYWLNWWELNHFHHPDADRHLGPILPPKNHPNFKARPNPRFIVAYLKPTHRLSAMVLRLLQGQSYKILAFMPGASMGQIASLGNHGITVTTKPLNLDILLPQAACFVCHGGLASTTLSLSHGTPPIIVPTQVEQFRLYTRLRELRLTPEIKFSPNHYFVRMNELAAIKSSITSYSDSKSVFPKATQLLFSILKA